MRGGDRREDQNAVILSQLFDKYPVTHLLREANFCLYLSLFTAVIFTSNWKLNSTKTSHVKVACSHPCVSDAYSSGDRSPQSLAIYAVLESSLP